MKYGQHPAYITKRDDQRDEWRTHIETLAREPAPRDLSGRRVIIAPRVQQPSH